MKENALESLKWVIKPDNFEDREQLLISWYKNHVREFQVSHWSDSVSESNKSFAKYAEEQMLQKAILGLVKKAEIITEKMGNDYVRKLRVIVLVDTLNSKVNFNV